MMEASASSASPALTPPPGNPRFPLFDGLRAIAALSVVVYHVGFYSRANEGGSGLSPYLARLNVGVAVFFVISGFLLYRPLLHGRLAGRPVRLRDYARRRVLRIVPAYWVALTVLAVVVGLPGVFTGHWWIYYGFAQDYNIHTETQGIGPAWSLSAEAAFYVVLPLLSLALGRAAAMLGRPIVWQLELAVFALLSGASLGWHAYANTHPSIPPSTFASTFMWFALGMALALMSVLAGNRPSAARYSWLGWVIAPVAYLVICRGLGLGGGFVFFERQSTAQDMAVYALSGLVAVGLALPAVFEPARRNLVRRVLGSRLAASLGLVSYGIFLYHQPVANALNGGVRSGGSAATRFIWLLAATAAISVCAAAVSYFVVERPALRLKDPRTRQPAPAQPLPLELSQS